MDNIDISPERPVAYFCAEFAFNDQLPIYSGGLGVLAADAILEAAAENLPYVAVGLLYRDGFFHQSIDTAGEQIEHEELVRLSGDQLTLVRDDSGEPVKVNVEVGTAKVAIQIWRHQVGNIPVYLLDSDVEENGQFERHLTNILYPAEPSHRLAQEIVLGIGGVRALKALGVSPALYHMNEGHSALAAIAIMADLKDGITDPDKLLQLTKQKVVFTNHTLVPAGNDQYDPRLVRELLQQYDGHVGEALSALICQGQHVFPAGTTCEQMQQADQNALFVMTNLALNMSYRANAVSHPHEKFAEKMWPAKDLTVISNAVYFDRWIRDGIKDVLTSVNWQVEQLEPQALWRAHLEQKQHLSQWLRQNLGRSLDPEKFIMTWGRRFATYKQPDLIFSDITRLKSILLDEARPAYLLMTGKAHPADDGAKAIIEKIMTAIRDNQLESHVIFIPDYSLEIAQLLVAGSDLWLNTPQEGQEASGTSGMKSGANGVLQCSTNEGWMAQVNWSQRGWILPYDNTAAALYETLEQKIIPLYYEQTDGLSPGWVEMMKQTMAAVHGHYRTDRMIGEYIERLYKPALEAQKGQK